MRRVLRTPQAWPGPPCLHHSHCPTRPCLPPRSARQVMLTRPSHMAASFDPDTIKGKAALVRGRRLG